MGTQLNSLNKGRFLLMVMVQVVLFDIPPTILKTYSSYMSSYMSVKLEKKKIFLHVHIFTVQKGFVSAGLTEILIEHIKQTHAKLNMSSLQVGKPTLSKGKDDAIVQELTLTFDLLRNFMYQSEEVKVRLLII